MALLFFSVCCVESQTLTVTFQRGGCWWNLVKVYRLCFALDDNQNKLERATGPTFRPRSWRTVPAVRWAKDATTVLSIFHMWKEKMRWFFRLMCRRPVVFTDTEAAIPHLLMGITEAVKELDGEKTDGGENECASRQSEQVPLGDPCPPPCGAPVWLQYKKEKWHLNSPWAEFLELLWSVWRY